MREFHQGNSIEYDTRGDFGRTPESAEHVAMPLGFLHQFPNAFCRFGALDAGLIADLLKPTVGEAGHATSAPIEVAADGEL